MLSYQLQSHVALLRPACTQAVKTKYAALQTEMRWVVEYGLGGACRLESVLAWAVACCAAGTAWQLSQRALSDCSVLHSGVNAAGKLLPCKLRQACTYHSCITDTLCGSLQDEGRHAGAPAAPAGRGAYAAVHAAAPLLPTVLVIL
jgi:hypothetical protein